MKLFCFGIGYSAQTLIRLHGGAFDAISGTVRSAAKAEALLASGVDAFAYAGGAADEALEEAIRQADALLVSAAPDERGDPMLRQLRPALEAASSLKTIVYLSTVGVYGDHGGAWIDEDAPLLATSERGRRRIEAEAVWADFGAERGIAVQRHRLAGIYGPGRSAIDDLRQGWARRIVKEGQVFNRIHVEDIAGAAVAGIGRSEVSGAFNICDDEPSPPQDVVAHAAGLLGIEPPAEIPFAKAELSEMARSFYAESKRCSNQRMKRELGYRLRYPTYREGLAALAGADGSE